MKFLVKLFNIILLLFSNVFVFSQTKTITVEGDYQYIDSRKLKNSSNTFSIPTYTVTTINLNDPNYNNLIDADEKCYLYFSITNTGKANTKNLKCNITTNKSISGLSIDKYYSIGELKIGETKEIKINLISTLELVSDSATLTISFDEQTGNYPNSLDYKFQTKKFQTPYLKVLNYTFSSKNGKIELGETAQLECVIQNTGLGVAQDCKVQFEFPDGITPIANTIFDESIIKNNETKNIICKFLPTELYKSSEIIVRIVITEKYNKYSENLTATIKLNTSTEISVNENTNTIIEETNVEINIPEIDIIYKNRFALIIGNEHYIENGGLQSDVDFAINDAETFKQYSIKTLGIPESNIIIIEDATRTEMKKKIDLFISLMDISPEKREFYFFYAGHGYPDENKDAYLMPVDISAEYIEDGIKLSELYEKLIQKSPKRITVFLDACFSGGGRNGDNLVSARSGVKIVPNETALTGNLVIFAASSEDQVSKPYEDKKHGLFSYVLFKTLQEYNGEITYSQLADELIEGVSTLSITINGTIQVPKVNVSINVVDLWEKWNLN